MGCSVFINVLQTTWGSRSRFSHLQTAFRSGVIVSSDRRVEEGGIVEVAVTIPCALPF